MRLHRASNLPCRRAKREFQRNRARIYCFGARAREMMIHKAARRRSYRLIGQPNRPSDLLRRRAFGLGTSQSCIPCHSCPESHLDHGARPALLSNDQYSEIAILVRRDTALGLPSYGAQEDCFSCILMKERNPVFGMYPLVSAPLFLASQPK
jgi:hypothetical protein